MGSLFSFSQKERIKKKRDFNNVFNSGNKITAKHYTFYYTGSDLGFARIGIIAKKYIGNAVTRNYEKRLIREFFRLSKHQIPSYDIVCIIKKPDDTVLNKRKSFAFFLSSFPKEQ